MYKNPRFPKVRPEYDIKWLILGTQELACMSDILKIVQQRCIFNLVRVHFVHVVGIIKNIIAL